uniref:fibronectin type III domain-containing protein n=1 Tax=Nonlabens sp. TaxID=1888209 RepID=UPI003F6A009F
MKLKLLLSTVFLIASWQLSAQFGCGSAVVLTDGYTATGITTPGTGGPEDWNNNPTGTSITASYFDDDVYLFEYTSGATVEDITMSIQSNNSWNGIAIFDDCSGMDLSTELDAVGSTTSGPRTVSARLQPNNTVYIAVGQWGTPNDLDFDVTNFSVTAISCLEPAAIAVQGFDATTVDLSWTDSATEVGGYNWEVVPAGSAQGTGVVASGTTAVDAVALNVPGLTPDTAYDFYIQSVCVTSTSAWSTPVNFRTACAVIVPDAIETFDTFVPNCWEEATGGDLTTGPTGLGSGDWLAEEFAHATTSGGGAVNVNLYDSGTSDWVISPLYDLSAGGYELNIDI